MKEKELGGIRITSKAKVLVSDLKLIEEIKLEMANKAGGDFTEQITKIEPNYLDNTFAEQDLIPQVASI